MQYLITTIQVPKVQSVSTWWFRQHENKAMAVIEMTLMFTCA